MLSDRLDAASLAGLLSLITDVASLAWQTTTLTDVPTVLQTLLIAANFSGIVLGILAARRDRSDAGTVGLHLSWAWVVSVPRPRRRQPSNCAAELGRISSASSVTSSADSPRSSPGLPSPGELDRLSEASFGTARSAGLPDDSSTP
jgi:hypothetical protein